MGTTNEPKDVAKNVKPGESTGGPADSEGRSATSLNVAAFDEQGEKRDSVTRALITRVVDLESELHWEVRFYVEVPGPEDQLPACHRTTRAELDELVETLSNGRHELYERLMPEVSAANLPRWTRELAELGAAMMVFEDAYRNSGFERYQPRPPDRAFRLPEELRLTLRLIMEKADPPSWPDL